MLINRQYYHSTMRWGRAYCNSWPAHPGYRWTGSRNYTAQMGHKCLRLKSGERPLTSPEHIHGMLIHVLHDYTWTSDTFNSKFFQHVFQLQPTWFAAVWELWAAKRQIISGNWRESRICRSRLKAATTAVNLNYIWVFFKNIVIMCIQRSTMLDILIFAIIL